MHTFSYLAILAATDHYTEDAERKAMAEKAKAKGPLVSTARSLISHISQVLTMKQGGGGIKKFVPQSPDMFSSFSNHLIGLARNKLELYPMTQSIP